jgi:hypothetical protein
MSQELQSLQSGNLEEHAYIDCLGRPDIEARRLRRTEELPEGVWTAAGFI